MGLKWNCVLMQKLETACADFPNVVGERHIFMGRVRTQWVYDPKFELGQDFCTMQVSSSYVYSFGSYRVDKQSLTK